jgi:hypothetical protein
MEFRIFVKYRKINKTVVEILILDIDISNMKLKPVWMRPINNILFLAAFLFLSLQGFGQAIIVEVWPGDANNDGVVNTKDVFTLGLYAGIEGPSRFELEYYLDGADTDYLEFEDSIFSVEEFYQLWDEYYVEIEDDEETWIDTLIYGGVDTASGGAYIYYEEDWYDEFLEDDEFEGFWFEEEDFLEEEDFIVFSEFGLAWLEEDGDTMYNGEDFAYADCDGDGEIGTLWDLGEIYFNFEFGDGNRSASRTGGLPVSFEYDTDTIIPGSTITIDVKVGSEEISLEDMYGLAMKLNMNSDLVNVEQTQLSIENSALGGSDEVIPFAVKDPETGALEFAITRNTGTGQSSNGTVIKILAVIEDDIGGVTAELDVFDLDISNVNLVTADGAEVPTSVDDKGIQVRDTTVSNVGSINETQLVAYPNPAETVLNILVSKNIETIAFINLLGETMYHQVVSTDRQFSIDVQDYQTGMYFIKYQSAGNASIQKVMIK